MNDTGIISLGIFAIIFGSGFVYYVLKTRTNKTPDIWNYSMLFRGIVGGLLFIILGIFMIINILKN
jgi:uncharacterized membrane protein HdeD (DUF308 family)